MLITCPECLLQISDKAKSCPHCGYPMNKPKKRGTNKRRRLPNGFGQITEIKDHYLRKPFRAMVTVGKDSSGRPISKLLKPEAYFETYNEAYAALLEYNRNPYDLSPSITMEELYNRWYKEHFKNINSNNRIISSAWKYCSSIYSMRVADVRVRHMKGVIDNGFIVTDGIEKYPSDGTKNRIKSLFNMMFDYAVEYELIDRNYARDFKLPSIKEDSDGKHIAFTDAEMKLLWDNLYKEPYVDMVLIQCYSGWRPQELCQIEISNVDLENWTFTGGMKTEAGKNRCVPIHSSIRSLVKYKYDEAINLGSPYLFNCNDNRMRLKDNKKMTYDKYRSRFKNIIADLDLNKQHRTHDGRIQFVTICKKYNVDEYAIKYMIGHTINDLTEKVYTKRDVAWLRDEIEKIKGDAWCTNGV